MANLIHPSLLQSAVNIASPLLNPIVTAQNPSKPENEKDAGKPVPLEKKGSFHMESFGNFVTGVFSQGFDTLALGDKDHRRPELSLHLCDGDNLDKIKEAQVKHIVLEIPKNFQPILDFGTYEGLKTFFTDAFQIMAPYKVQEAHDMANMVIYARENGIKVHCADESVKDPLALEYANYVQSGKTISPYVLSPEMYEKLSKGKAMFDKERDDATIASADYISKLEGNVIIVEGDAHLFRGPHQSRALQDGTIQQGDMDELLSARGRKVAYVPFSVSIDESREGIHKGALPGPSNNPPLAQDVPEFSISVLPIDLSEARRITHDLKEAGFIKQDRESIASNLNYALEFLKGLDSQTVKALRLPETTVQSLKDDLRQALHIISPQYPEEAPKEKLSPEDGRKLVELLKSVRTKSEMLTEKTKIIFELMDVTSDTTIKYIESANPPKSEKQLLPEDNLRPNPTPPSMSEAKGASRTII